VLDNPRQDIPLASVMKSFLGNSRTQSFWKYVQKQKIVGFGNPLMPIPVTRK
jgi:hypothetical protein